MKVERITTSSEEWKTLSDEGHFFQTPQWTDLLSRHFPEFKLYPLRFTFSNERTFILPLIKYRYRGKLLFSFYGLPHGTFGGILGSSSPSADELAAMMKQLRKFGLLKIVFHLPPGKKIPDYPGLIAEAKSTQIVDLQKPLAEIEGGYQRILRQNINQAARSELIVSREKSSSHTEAFCEIYQQSAEQWAPQGRMPQSLLAEICEHPAFEIWTAHWNGEIISSYIGMAHNGMSVAWLGAMKRDFTKYHPSKAILAEMINYYHGQGCRSFDLGGSIGNKNIEQFKARFGAETVDIYSYEYHSALFGMLKRLKG